MHWFQQMQQQAQKESERMFASFQEFEQTSSVSVSSFATSVKQNSYGQNQTLRSDLFTQSKQSMEEFSTDPTTESFNKLKTQFAKLEITDSFLAAQETTEKMKVKQEQLQQLQRVTSGLGHPGYQQVVHEIVQKEKQTLTLLQEEQKTKMQRAEKTVQFYEENDQSHKHSLSNDVKKEENRLTRIHENIQQNSKKLSQHVTQDRFSVEALNMAQRSRNMPEVEHSALKLAKLNDQQVEFAQQYTQLKKQASVQVQHVKEKQNHSNLEF